MAEAKPELEDDNFAINALFCAIEAGNLPGIRHLLKMAPKLDINQRTKQGSTAIHLAAGHGHIDIVQFLREKGMDLNLKDKHGDDALFWAARQGHTHMVKFLKDEGMELDAVNKSGEASLHIAARYGHSQTVEYVISAGANINLTDKFNESALHNAAWHGYPTICERICTEGCELDTENKDGETPLHNAVARGNTDCVKVLLKAGVNVNLKDKTGATCLHIACQRHMVSIALLILHAGCDLDIPDKNGESALHISVKESLSPIVQTLCAFGCQVDVCNQAGLTPLHLAARTGDMDIVRCLLLSGAEPLIKNGEGVSAEIMALASGNPSIAETLTRMKPERQDSCIDQLIPTNKLLSCIKLKIFGSSGVGKTKLVETLKCGYFSNFFKKRFSSPNVLFGSSSQEKETTPKRRLLPSNKVDIIAVGDDSPERIVSMPSQFSLDVCHQSYTKGVDVQQINISGAGNFSVWEFSGYDPYYVAYDHFIGDPHCLHIIVFSLEDPPEVQIKQVKFWCNFLITRMPRQEIFGFAGRSPYPPKLLLLASHADKIGGCVKNTKGETVNPQASFVLQEVIKAFQYEFDICDTVYIMDGQSVTLDVKNLKLQLADIKAQIIKTLPCTNGFLDAVCRQLPFWRKALATYPVLTWRDFVSSVRSKVNPLASDEHLSEVIQQLQYMGEVLYIETSETEDYIVFDPKWLCSNLLGEILSHEKIMEVRVTGCFTEHDFHLLYPESEAVETLRILEALELCTACENDGDTEYEFPALNFVEKLQGLWESSDVVALSYGGVRLRVQSSDEMPNLLVHCFSRIQVQLRRSIPLESQIETDLYQWYHGSRFSSGDLECMITLENDDQSIEIKVRGPSEQKGELFFFFTDMVSLVDGTISDVCPNLILTKTYLSSTSLYHHERKTQSFNARDIVQAHLDHREEIVLENGLELLRDMICLGCESIYKKLQFGINLHISYLRQETCRLLCRTLDPPDSMGKDWCLLALQLGLQEKVPNMDSASTQSSSPTMKLLTYLGKTESNTVGGLIRKLREMGRDDACYCIMDTMLVYRCPKSAKDGARSIRTSHDKATSPDLDLDASSASR